jgi:dihydropyrimidine dehydrogenase (NAD+) subunit PreA
MAVRKDLSIEYLGVMCENPFFLSSSPVAGNYDMVAKAFETGWGGVFFKTIGIFVADECSPRFDQNNKGGVPWIGFKNMEQISDKPTEQNFEFIYRLKKDYPDKVVVASVMGSNEDEWRELGKMSEQAGADMIECNFSCPQMTSHEMGSDVGTNLELVENYTRVISSVTKLPVIAKMTPNITVMEPAAIAAVKGGAKGISAINTVKSITSLDYGNLTAMPVVDGKSSISGYSGTAVKPIGLRFIANLASCPDLKGIPLSGIGGIETWNDCLDYMLVGARNVQVTTAVMQYGYEIVKDMINGMSHFMDERGIDDISELVGLALPNIVPAEDLNRDFKVIPKIDQKKCVGCGRCYVSCYDAAHQAIDWDSKKRKPSIDDEKCVGCHLCLNVCPVKDCILPGEIKWKEGRKQKEVKIKENYL